MSQPSQRDARRVMLWAVVVGGVIGGLSIGIRHVHGLFMLPMTMDRGWSRETFSFSLALQNLCWGFAAPLAGWVADRYGSGRVIALGVLLYATALCAFSTAQSSAMLYLTCGLGIGVAQACTAFGSIYAALNRLVPAHQRGWANGVAGAIGAAVQFLAVPGTSWLIAQLGWQSALVGLGVVLACALPACAMLRERAGDRAARQAASLVAASDALHTTQALRLAFADPGFRWLLTGFAVCGFQLAFIANHLPAYLLGQSAAGSVAVIGLGLIALANIPGTYICGRLGDRYPPQRLLAGVYLVRVLAMALFVLLPKSTFAVYAFCLVMGAIWLGTLPLTNALVVRLFGVAHIGTLFGLTFLSHQVGAFAGVWLGGWVFDVTRSYELMWSICMGAGLMAALVHLPIKSALHPRFAGQAT